MRKNRLLLAGVTLFLFLLNSCEGLYPGCIQGNGRIAYEERFIGDFENIISYGSFSVEIKLSDKNAIAIEADENLISYIETNISGNTLVLDTENDRCLSSREPIIIYVDAITVQKLKLSGSGVIYCDNLENNEIDIDLSGSGKISCQNMDSNYVHASLSGSGEIEFEGLASTSDFNITGSGIIRAINLQTNRCYANISGSGNIYTWVNQKLDVNISGSGNLYYKGNPEVIKKITGSGNIRQYK